RSERPWQPPAPKRPGPRLVGVSRLQPFRLRPGRDENRSHARHDVAAVRSRRIGCGPMNGADPGPSPRAEDEAIAMAEPDGAGAATVVLRDTPRPGGDGPPAPQTWCGPARLWLLGAAWFTWLCGYAYVTLES